MIIVIPKNAPVIQNLHSYYVDVRKLIEHYQGEIGCGGILLSEPTGEGAIFSTRTVCSTALSGARSSPSLVVTPSSTSRNAGRPAISASVCFDCPPGPSTIGRVSPRRKDPGGS